MAPHPKKKGPKKHGLDKKYKSWRRGKSVNATCGASLKNQLRGQKRLLSKLRNGNDDKTIEMKTIIEHRIQELENQIEEKERVGKERSNAMK